MDWSLIEQKLESLRRCLRRVREKCPLDEATLTKDYDAQDILTLNLSRAIQLCVDIGAHLVTQTDQPAPSTMGQTFDVLSDAGIINSELAGRMKKAVGFRNLVIHHYDDINWAIVYTIVQHRLIDFEDFARAVVMLQSR